MNESGSIRICPECGLKLPGGAEHSICPGCSLRLALSAEEMAPSDASSRTPSGLKSRFFGDYEILDEIARGGMGVVYRARQLSLNRVVALKMVQSHHLLSVEARLRFRVEIEAVAQLNHPHIVSLYESDERDGTHYFTMPLIEGGDLAAHLKRERPVREWIQLLVKVCRAVHYAHQRGIFHRDLKPSNILLDQYGEPHVADFGLARQIDQDTGFTFSSSILGSPNYMAPEQASGGSAQLTTAVDVYGLGAILYQMLSGRPPFQAGTPIETLRKVLDSDPIPPRALKPTANVDLETIALKCLLKKPAERYGTAEELAQDLERWLEGRPIRARPLGFWSTAWRWAQRHPVRTGLGGALMLALLVIAVGSAFAVVRIREEQKKSSASLRQSLLREAKSLRLGGELGHRAEGLRLLREASALGGPSEFRDHLRNELLATLARTEVTFVPVTLSNLPAPPELSRIYPSFEMIATVDGGSNLVFRALADGTDRGRILTGEAVSAVEGFSPNGLYVAVRHRDHLSVRDLRTGRRCSTHFGTNIVFSFHPREAAVLIQAAPNVASFVDLPTGKERLRWTKSVPRLSGRSRGWHTLSFSPDGQAVAGASGTSRVVELMDATSGDGIGYLTNSAHTVAMEWNRDASALAVGTADCRIFVWDPASGALLWSSPSMVAPARCLAFHPTQNWLAAACEDGQVRIFDRHQQRLAFEYPADSRVLRFSPDGKRLGPLWSHGQLGWLEMQNPDEFIDFSVDQVEVNLTDSQFNSDGSVLAIGHLDMVILCDPTRGALFGREMEWRMSAFAFHPRHNYALAADGNGIFRYDPPLIAHERVSLSDPKRIHAGTNWRAFDFTPDARYFAAYSGASNRVYVFDHTLTNQVASFGPHTDAGALDISSNGRWVTTSSRNARSVRVWDVAAEQLILTIPVGLLPRGHFSNDGGWLAVTSDDFELREVGSWKKAALPFGESRPILGAAAFSPDSRILAVVADRFAVHLFDLRRMARVGILRRPGNAHIRTLAFSSDGSKLAATGAEARVAVWNLQKLQRRLAEFGLAWDASENQAQTRR